MLGSRHWGYEVSGPESHASCNQSAFGEPFEGLPQLGGSCDDQRLHLVDGLSPGLESRVLRGLQHADHLNLVHARFWSGMGYPGKHSTGSRLGVRWVTLPYPPTSRPIWPIDLNYGMSTACQEPSELRAVGPRALDPEALYVSMSAGPALEAGIPPGASC